MRRILNLGAGHRKGQDGIFFMPAGTDHHVPVEVVTLDMDAGCNPDIQWDLNQLPLPIDDNQYDQVHAYSVLEHVSTLGCYKHFFALFSELHRILVPDGKLVIQCPKAECAWNDPGHTRVITPTQLAFLSQDEYRRQVGVTRMTDYRWLYKADFKVLSVHVTPHDSSWIGVLQAVK